MRQALLVVLLAAAGACLAEEVAPRTGVFVLVDISATWLNKPDEAQDAQILRETNRAVLDLLGKAETPAAVYVIAIEADSVLKRPVCEAVYRRKLLSIGARRGEDFTRREDLENHLELCHAALLRRPPARWTDIHGALDLVSRIAAGARFNRKYLFVLSDFKEERPKGDLPRLELPEFRVAAIYRILPEDSRDPRALEARLQRWQELLKRAGAERVVGAVDKTRFAGNVVQKLLERGS